MIAMAADEDQLEPEEIEEFVEDFKKFFSDLLKEMQAEDNPLVKLGFLLATIDVVKKDPFDDVDVMLAILDYLEAEIALVVKQ